MKDIKEGAMEELVNNPGGWIYEWFEDIKDWEPYVKDGERLVRVRCHGLPQHAWGEGICKLMATTFGTFVDVDEYTRRKTSFDIARFMI